MPDARGQGPDTLLWRFREAWAPGGKEICWVAGDDGVMLDWLPEGLALLRERLADPDFLADVNGILADWGELRGEIPTALRPADDGREWAYRIESPFRLDFDAYAKAKGLKFTLRKVDGACVYELSKDSLKKRLLKSLTAVEVEGPNGKEWTVDAECAAKFSADEFLREAFLLPASAEWVRSKAFAVWLPQEAIITAAAPARLAGER